MAKVRKIKGTHDILPEEAAKWRYLEAAIHEVMRRYGFGEIRTPMFEETALFARGIGLLTDIVSKEMYTFKDRSDKSLTLKPEGTAAVIRAYIEHALGERRPLNRLYYLSPMFRQENPQAGRLRQFHQFGAEIIGSPHPEADVESIALALDIYKKLGLKAFTLKLNSVGDAACRDPYKIELRAFLKSHKQALCKSCQERADSNPLRVLDCKEDRCQPIIAAAPRLLDHLCPGCRAHLDSVQAMLKHLGIDFEVDFRLVRGLDYYTRTAYEIIGSALGAQNALGGGGRYDLLAEELGGKPTPAVGFAAGIERLLIALESENALPAVGQSVQIFIALLGEQGHAWGQSIAKALREQGFSVEADLMRRSLKAQMKEANRAGARFAIIIGADEIQSATVTVRDLAASTQQEVPYAEVAHYLRRAFGLPEEAGPGTIPLSTATGGKSW